MNISIQNILLIGVLCLCFSCKKGIVITPDYISEQTAFDADDPAIWFNNDNPDKSVIFGTDKHTNGGVYAFDLKGEIIDSLTIRNIKRPNNVDIGYSFPLNDTLTTDFLVTTEREAQQLRFFSIPNLRPLDLGGIKVFEDEKITDFKFPMGVATYQVDHKFYIFISRKKGPKQGYLYQYQIKYNDSLKTIQAKLVRKFGAFSGKKEIEAIAVDAQYGVVYYADETHCIRKYYANPARGNQEISCFGESHFKRDIEGIAIAKTSITDGYIIVSDQQNGTFNFFDRKTNNFIQSIDLSTKGTDGCEVIASPVGALFPNGIFVAMNDNKNFYIYNFSKLLYVLNQ